MQDNYFMKVFQVADRGTPVCMVRLDSQTLQVKWQILLKKIKQVRKTMDKDEENICKKVPIAGMQTCGNTSWRADFAPAGKTKPKSTLKDVASQTT